MGIPRFFGIIIEKYANTHFWDPNLKIDHLFIDFNSVVYNCYHAIDMSKYKNANETKIDNKIIAEVLKYLKHLISDVTKPLKSVYIAIDGPAPRAKMVQQRMRRFKGILERKMTEELKKKHNILETKSWDKTKISPGTKFMLKLSDNIKKQIKAGYFTEYTDNKINIVLSDANVAGEGEHKYMNVIRSLDKTDPSDSVCVYSPDADVLLSPPAVKPVLVKLVIIVESVASAVVASRCIYLVAPPRLLTAG